MTGHNPVPYPEAVLSAEAIQFRLTSEADLEALLRLENVCFVSYYKPHRFDGMAFRFYLGNPSTISFVAVVDHGVAGYVLGQVIVEDGERLACLDSLAVEPGARERGIGGGLTRKFLAEAHSRRCASVSLEVATKNLPAIHLFGKLGFRRVESLPQYYDEHTDGFRMRLAV